MLNEQWTQAGPDLSPDGQTVVFGRLGNYDPPSEVAIYLYGLHSHALSRIPGSEGMVAPRWSPDGRYLVAGASSSDGGGMLLWDFRTRNWKRLVGPQEEPLFNAEWSRDSRYLYYGCSMNHMDAICRVSVPDGRAELVVPSWKFHREDTTHSGFAGLTPQGSPLFTQIYKDFDVSALSFQFSR
jgi:Tol biopolymer transport system component